MNFSRPKRSKTDKILDLDSKTMMWVSVFTEPKNSENIVAYWIDSDSNEWNIQFGSIIQVGLVGF